MYVIVTHSSNCDGDNTAVVAGSVAEICGYTSWECLLEVSTVGMYWLIGSGGGSGGSEGSWLAMVDVNLEENKMSIAWITLLLGGRQKKMRPSEKWQKEKILIYFSAIFSQLVYEYT